MSEENKTLKSHFSAINYIFHEGRIVKMDLFEDTFFKMFINYNKTLQLKHYMTHTHFFSFLKNEKSQQQQIKGGLRHIKKLRIEKP